MTDEKAYESPQALRQAVTDRLRALATPKGRWTLAELQRQFAYDRLLARLYVIDDSWVLKGAVALLARQVSVRHSTDIDLYRDAERTMVERELRAGAELDLGDWFRFDIGVGENLSGATGGKRYPVTAWIGATRWATFHVDLVGTGVRMTGVPDHVSSVVEISIPGIEQPGYRAYPLVDHVADVTSLVACGMPGFSHRNPVSTTRSLCGVGSIASQSDSGVPDVWSIYLATDDAGKTVDAVCANGGQMYVQASAVGDLGTMAVVGDPGGSILRAANEARYGRLAAAADPTGVNPRQRRIVVGRREGAREDSACTVQPTRCLVGVRVVLGANLPQPPSVPTE